MMGAAAVRPRTGGTAAAAVPPRQAPAPARRLRPGPGAVRLLCVLLATLALGGCTRLLLSQLDWIAVWYVDGYFDLTDRQEAIVRDGVRRGVGQFRREELPGFLSVLGELRGDLARPVTPAVVDARITELERLGGRTAGLLVNDSVLLLRTMSASQVDELFATLAENTAELAEEYSGRTPAERRERQRKQVLRFTRRMTGSLSDAQEQLLAVHVARFHDLAPEWLIRRRGWQDALRSSLASDRAKPEFAAQIADLILEPNRFDSPRYRGLVAENRAVICEMVAALMATLTPAQRAHVERELRDYERSLVGLAAA